MRLQDAGSSCIRSSLNAFFQVPPNECPLWNSHCPWDGAGVSSQDRPTPTFKDRRERNTRRNAALCSREGFAAERPGGFDGGHPQNAGPRTRVGLAGSEARLPRSAGFSIAELRSRSRGRGTQTAVCPGRIL